jgi:hypothetical protein
MDRITGCRVRQAVAFAVIAWGMAVSAPKAYAADQTTVPAGPQPARAAPVAQAAPRIPATPSTTVQIAKSALLEIEGTPTTDTFDLRIRKISDKSLIASDNVTVTIDGRNESVTRVNVDTYQMPLSDLKGDGAREVEIIVPHDGIREILSGKVALPETGSTASLLRDHKQVGWWILNIVIVLIAAIAISRRKG